MLRIKIQANQAISYCQLIYSGPYQSLAASAMQCDTNVQSYSTDWTRRTATRSYIFMLTGCISTEISNAGVLN